LIRVLTGIEIPYGKLGTHFGVQCFNVGSAHAVSRAVEHGEPLVSRVLTLSGNMTHPGNFDVLIGTPIRELLPLAGPRADTDRYLMGGPMMGVALQSLDMPVVKGTNCILAGSPVLFPPPPPEMPCIRCGACAQVCPAELQPFELYWFSRAKIFGKARNTISSIALSAAAAPTSAPHGFPWWITSASPKAKSGRAKRKSRRRHGPRTLRIPALTGRKGKGRKGGQTRRQDRRRQGKSRGSTGCCREAAATPEEDAKKALIAAALERARAQKEQVQPENVSDLTPEQQAEVAAIEGRRAEIREMAKPQLRQED
jgi:electron transport complex protein RnfC